MSEKFSFAIPMEILSKSSGSELHEMRIGGFASTPDPDRQGDALLQRGLDISDFLEHGFFNFDHDNTKILGYPDADKCKLSNKGFYVEGTLLKGVPLAEQMYATALALKNQNAPRHLGFSVEGEILERDPIDESRVLRAKVYNVAITANPVNTSCTWDALVKALTAEPVEKALTAGYGDANGSPLVPEDLERALRTLSYAVGNDSAAKQNLDELRKRLLRSNCVLTKSEYALWLQLSEGCSKGAALLKAAKLWNKEECNNG